MATKAQVDPANVPEPPKSWRQLLLVAVLTFTVLGVNFGARHLINYQEDANWGQTAFKLAGAGVDLVVDTGGAQTLSQSFRAVRVGGSVSIIGVVSGKRIWATFTRVDGCQVARWQRISPWLVPAGGVTG